MNTQPTKDDLTAACREELEHLWYDLMEATRRAANGRWSIQCEGLQERIQTLTKLVGPTSWECVQIDLIETGVYRRINHEVGFEVHPDMAKVAEVREHSRQRVQLARQWAGRP